LGLGEFLAAQEILAMTAMKVRTKMSSWECVAVQPTIKLAQ
jgi:hypothetical protein